MAFAQEVVPLANKLQNNLNYTDLSSWHGFGIHGIMLHSLAHFTKGHTQHFPDGALPWARGTNDHHTHSLSKLLVQFKGLFNL